MNYSLTDLATITNGTPISASNSASIFTHLLYDSRKLVFPETTLFIALSGKRRNGHQYLKTLYEQGVRCFLVEKNPTIQEMPDAGFVQVSDTLIALQELAKHHRTQFQLPVIGITGSNGKTIVKEWLFQLLKNRYKIVRSPKSYNSQIGVPLSVWNTQSSHTLGIFEAGISQPKEMPSLETIIRPTIGIFTNIGDAHSGGFSSTKIKIKEKLKLFKNTKHLIYCKDHLELDRAVKKQFSGTLLNWSTKKTAYFQIIKMETSSQGTTKLTGERAGKTYRITIPFTHQAAVENAIHCWVASLFLKLPSQQIRTGMKQLQPIAMRLELKAGVNNCLLINDSYNADLQALTTALQFMNRQSEKNRKRTLILSDILESKLDKTTLYKKIAAMLSQHGIDRVIGVGNSVKMLKKHLPKNIKSHFHTDTQHFLKVINIYSFKDEIILLKGARIFQFEKIVSQLIQKHHQTILEVNLAAMRHNLQEYARQLHADTKIMVMVKASAYGVGSTEIGRLLSAQSIHYLAVAYTDEGIALRQAGIQLPILVLNPEEASLNALMQHHLESEIFSIPQLERMIELLNLETYPPNSFPIHVNLDTGMVRLGLSAADFPTLFQLLTRYPAIRISSIFTHLASSDLPKHDRFTEEQIQLFQGFYTQIISQIGYQPTRHVLNSSGISRFPQYQMEMVRLGIGLYGYDGNSLQASRLETVHTLKASISQIKLVKKGTTIGYGRNGRVTKDSRIATVSVGYADGLLRKAGNGRFKALLRGVRVPTIGNICMDMCMMDVTEVPQACAGDEVVIFGLELPVTELATCLDTIPYEIFTGISERVRRVYFEE